MTNGQKMTIAPVEAGNTENLQPEFIRDRDASKLFGLKRGTLRNLHRKGKIRGVLLRVCGQKSGVRLWAVDSIRKLIEREMASQVGSDIPSGSQN